MWGWQGPQRPLSHALPGKPWWLARHWSQCQLYPIPVIAPRLSVLDFPPKNCWSSARAQTPVFLPTQGASEETPTFSVSKARPWPLLWGPISLLPDSEAGLRSMEQQEEWEKPDLESVLRLEWDRSSFTGSCKVPIGACDSLWPELPWALQGPHGLHMAPQGWERSPGVMQGPHWGVQGPCGECMGPMWLYKEPTMSLLSLQGSAVSLGAEQRSHGSPAQPFPSVTQPKSARTLGPWVGNPGHYFPFAFPHGSSHVS